MIWWVEVREHHPTGADPPSLAARSRVVRPIAGGSEPSRAPERDGLPQRVGWRGRLPGEWGGRRVGWRGRLAGEMGWRGRLSSEWAGVGGWLAAGLGSDSS